MRSLTLTSSFVFLATLLFAQQPDPSSLGGDGLRVWKRVQDLNAQVFGTKDSATIQGFLHKNLHYGHSTGKLENMPEMVHNAVVSTTHYKNVAHRLISMKLLNNAAVVRYVLSATAHENNVESPLELGIIQVWQKEGGNWLLLERQAVRLTPARN